jgi:DNA-binding response OmpR family regulator
MPDTPLIAVVEDEEHLAQGLLFNLEAEGYRTHHEADGDAALTWLLDPANTPAAILLDVMLPGRDGFSIVRSLRHAGIYTPVLLLTARGRSEDIVEGFAAGADDYLPKPFDLGVLFARLTALLRRMSWQGATPATPAPEALPAPTVELAGRTIDFSLLEIRSPSIDGNFTTTIHLTLMEADLLRYLLDRPNQIVSRKDLLEDVWHVHEDTDTRAIDNFIVRLRRFGYRFVPGNDLPT